MANSLFHHCPNPGFLRDSRLETAVRKSEVSLHRVI